MTEIGPTDLLSALPKRAPIWSVGLATVLVALTVSITSVYVLGRDDVRQIIGWAEQHHEQNDLNDLKRHEAADAAINKSYDATLSVVHSLVNANASQLVELSKSLGATQQQNILLTDRVSALEKIVSSLKDTLSICEANLQACEKK